MIPTAPTPPTPPTDYEAPTPTGSIVTTYAELAAELALAGPRIIVIADGDYSGAGLTTAQGHQVWAQSRGGVTLRFGIGWRGNGGVTGGGAFGIIFRVDDIANVDATALLNEAIINTWDAVDPIEIGSGLTVEDCEFYGEGVIGAGIQAANPDGLTVRRCVFRDFVDTAISAFRNGSAPDAFDVITLEDLDIARISRPVPGSALGVSAELGINVGHTCAIRRVKIRDCAWAGVAFVNEVSGWFIEDFDIDRCGFGLFELGSVGIYCEHSYFGTIRRGYLGPDMKVGINCEWNSDNTNPYLNSLVPRNSDIVISDVRCLAYKIGIHFDLSVARCEVSRCRIERAWFAGILDNNVFPDDSGDFPVPDGEEAIATTNVVDLFSCEFLLHPEVALLRHDQHGGAALLPTIAGWPLTAEEVDTDLLMYSRPLWEGQTLTRGPAQSWGARVGGDPADLEQELLAIEPGEMDVVQSALDRRYKQLEVTPGDTDDPWGDLLSLIGEVFDEPEAVLQSVDVDRHRRTAQGLQLEQIGALVGRPRGSLTSDEDYRQAILVDASTLFSSGTLPEVLELAEALVGQAGEVVEMFPAAFRLRIPDLSAARAALLADILSDVPGAAISAQLSTYDSANTGGWSSVYAPLPSFATSLEFRPSLATLVDEVTETVGTADGTAYLPGVDGRDFAGNTPGDRLDWDGIADFGDAPFTLACWVNIDAFANEQRLWSTQFASLSGSHFWSINTSRRLRLFGANATGAHLDVTSNDGLQQDTWHLVVVTCDGTNTAAGVRMFIDGEETDGYAAAIDGGGAQRSTDFQWSIGGREATDTNNIDGSISDFRAWSRVLSTEEVRHLYLEGIASGSFAGPNTSIAPANPAAWSSTAGATTNTRAHWAHARPIGS